MASNMVAASLGTETDGSILFPVNANSVVGIKPTVGLTSRSGIVPISPRQDTVGPLCRTVSDAVQVLDAIVGFDWKDAAATREASKLIPYGYKQFLKPCGSKGRDWEQSGAILVENLEINEINTILNATQSGEALVLVAEFNLALNAHLKDLIISPVRSLLDVIAFNQKFNILTLKRRVEKIMMENKLDALVTPGGYDVKGVPIGICFGGLMSSEPKLIEIAYGIFENFAFSCVYYPSNGRRFMELRICSSAAGDFPAISCRGKQYE
ncbi:hypothetical protein Sjap_001164 [Stephania japonica]|uniref:Amidase domain-containing protein n=1 Tax=Stephania japonica TaxID=461633 RepID=A0AAP0PT87_9MAGN